MRWALRSIADVPPDDGWLGPRERAVLAALDGTWRRAEWRLGRWAAHAALGADGIEVLPAPDGAPEAWDGAERSALAVSIAHRRGRALAVAAEDPSIGCDLEPLRPTRDVTPLVAWEAAAKALRRGLLDGEPPTVDLRAATFTVRWSDGTLVEGAWWTDGGWAFATAAA